MPAVDRNILRIGVYELLWADDVPDGVAISEAVQLARELSTDASPSFVNGLLARLLDLKPSSPSDGLTPPALYGRGEADPQAALTDHRVEPQRRQARADHHGGDGDGRGQQQEQASAAR